MLAHTPRKASKAVAKLIKSALANAGASIEEAAAFRIQTIAVDKGIVLRRYMPRARGMASPIRREHSHISLSLAPVTGPHETNRRVQQAGKEKQEDSVRESASEPTKQVAQDKK